MVAARLGFEKAIVGTRWAIQRPDCMDRLRKHYSKLAEGWLLARKADWSFSGGLLLKSTLVTQAIPGRFRPSHGSLTL